MIGRDQPPDAASPQSLNTPIPKLKMGKVFRVVRGCSGLTTDRRQLLLFGKRRLALRTMPGRPQVAFGVNLNTFRETRGAPI
jgi:hypothetical protein